MMCPFHLAGRIPQDMRKTVTDAWNGYNSVPIREEHHHINTLIIPWGRDRYKVAPQGFMASGDAYNQRLDAILSNFNDQVKCVDDTCMWANSIEAAFFKRVIGLKEVPVCPGHCRFGRTHNHLNKHTTEYKVPRCNQPFPNTN